jgi:hypothetical protein
MTMFENGAGTSWANRKPFSDRGIKIHRAEGEHETKQLQRQTRLPVDPHRLRGFSLYLFRFMS